jgi:hypothetical protein
MIKRVLLSIFFVTAVPLPGIAGDTLPVFGGEQQTPFSPEPAILPPPVGR